MSQDRSLSSHASPIRVFFELTTTHILTSQANPERGQPFPYEGHHTWEDFPNMGSLPIHGRCSHIWKVFPYTGRLPIYGKSSHTWEVFPAKPILNSGLKSGSRNNKCMLVLIVFTHRGGRSGNLGPNPGATRPDQSTIKKPVFVNMCAS
jgi:hypothetical protein